MISKDLIVELQKILQEEFGVALSLDETSQLGNFLLTYISTMIKVERGAGTNEK